MDRGAQAGMVCGTGNSRVVRWIEPNENPLRTRNPWATDTYFDLVAEEGRLLRVSPGALNAASICAAARDEIPAVASGPMLLVGLLKLRVLAWDDSEPSVRFPSSGCRDRLSGIDRDVR